jgi:hypothetical protein
MHRLRRNLSYANVAATLALVVAVAGIPTAVAISKGAKSNDINKKGNIRAGHVTAAKLADASVTAAKLANQNVTAAKLAAVDIIQKAADIQVIAFCPAGERLLSGGGTGANLLTSVPSSTPQGDGWKVVTASGPATAFAVCLKANAGP